MSHYAVAVFSDDGDFDSLLAPYSETDKEYFRFEPKPYKEIVADFERFKEQNPDWTLDMYLEDFQYIRKDGKWGYMHNPQGYWDWYTLDGKDYLFDPKDGVKLSEDEYYYRKHDIEWYPEDHEAEVDAKDFWDSFVMNEDSDVPSFWNREYYLERYKTKEQYVKEMVRHLPYAFITPDGVWHAPGRVGWFACSDETAEDADRYAYEWDRWIANEANPYVSIVDCHI